MTVAMLTVAASAAAQGDPAPPKRSPWRAELQLHGAWVPGGFEAQGGVGIGLAARFHGFEAGPEVWRYHLTMEDKLIGERQAFSSTAVVPLRVGYQYRFSELPIAVGAAAGLALVTGPVLTVAHCTTTLHGGLAPFLRGFVGLDLGYVMVGPHVTYTRSPSGTGTACGAALNGPDYDRRDYPATLPLDLQVGLSVTLGYP